eukprot:1637629-Rhodomonas_salina.1
MLDNTAAKRKEAKADPVSAPSISDARARSPSRPEKGAGPTQTPFHGPIRVTSSSNLSNVSGTDLLYHKASLCTSLLLRVQEARHDRAIAAAQGLGQALTPEYSMVVLLTPQHAARPQHPF